MNELLAVDGMACAINVSMFCDEKSILHFFLVDFRNTYTTRCPAGLRCHERHVDRVTGVSFCELILKKLIEMWSCVRYPMVTLIGRTRGDNGWVIEAEDTDLQWTWSSIYRNSHARIYKLEPQVSNEDWVVTPTTWLTEQRSNALVNRKFGSYS